MNSEHCASDQGCREDGGPSTVPDNVVQQCACRLVSGTEGSAERGRPKYRRLFALASPPILNSLTRRAASR